MTAPVLLNVPRADEAACDRVWTEQAANYGWNTDATLASQLKLAVVRKYCSADARLCDVGCGNGLFMRVLARECAHVTGVDLNADMLAECRAMIGREGISNADVIRSNASSLPLSDSGFDLVYCFSTLLLIPDVDGALREMVRILRPGGYLILDVAGRNNLSAIYWRRWYWRRGHFGLHAFSYPAIERKIEALGLRLVESHALGFCDQWKYVPGLHLMRGLDRVFHSMPKPERNLDYRISNRPGLFRLANRWYIAAQKAAHA